MSDAKPPADTSGARAVVGLIGMSLLLPLVLFGTAGRLDWGLGWLFTGLLLAISLGTRALLLRLSPDLLRERARSIDRHDVHLWDRLLILVAVGLGPLAIWVVAGLSQRFGASAGLPLAVHLVAAALLLAGGVFAGWAMVANRFFSAVVRIQRERGQVVIDQGPYAIVRHPGYAGSLLATVVMPLLLDTWWGLVPAGLCAAAIVVRTALEDRTLRRELAGYEAYTGRTRWRLVPGIW